jgi:hypothetical protein
MATTELLTDPSHTRADLATVRRAIREGWDIPEQLLSALPKIAGAMALDRTEKTANRLRAMETILKMKGQNDAQEPTAQQVEHHHTHELGPVTADNFAESKRKLAERIARIGRDS